MEKKKFTVIDTDLQKQIVIESEATNVAQLKADLRANGIDPEGKTIREGLTKIEFKDDSAILPHDVPYKGTTTNNLVFQLTKTSKRVKSGAMSRSDAYAFIKKHNLGEKVKAKFGKNFTCCKTDDLIKFVAANQPKVACAKVESPDLTRAKVVEQPAQKEEPKKEESEVAEPKAEAPKNTLETLQQNINNITNVVNAILGVLCDEELLDKETCHMLRDILNGGNNVKVEESEEEEKKENTPYSKREAEDLFKGWK